MAQNKSEKYVISVMFLSANKQDPLWNRVTAMLGRWIHGKPGFCHVELLIPNGQKDHLSSSIYQDETVTLTTSKRFANPAYHILSLTVSKAELAKIRAFVEDSHNRKVAFDLRGMMLASLPVQLGTKHTDKTFCSRYVTEALQAGGVECVMPLNSATTTPTKLRNVIQKGSGDKVVACSVPHKQDSLKSQPQTVIYFNSKYERIGQESD